jgi:Leucine-rich repeat (LRR) protein
MKSMPAMAGLFALDYLEMCGVQLNQLPQDFAQQAPHLTVLCLCHNHLECIKPLRKLYRLRKLVLLNNRLENVNDLVKNLHRLGALRYLDLR